ncbi:MAG: imidazole glycerol phosphate synthase subunit HisH [Tannerella sp.]|jgi:glutamine amidotransferase|nr:imidazole glycerol phosphate synthase subunit HisH [Tannerella sp.]
MNVVIIKYNAGNIRSVDYGLRRLGVTPEITDDAERIRKADRVVFPGQGEASTTIRYLRERGLDRVIRELKQPVLGICIGMQLMCRHSDEGDVDCLGIFDADVKRFIPRQHADKIPHMGWNTVKGVRSELFSGALEGRFVYFVHSYYVPVTDGTIAETDYIHPFSAALRKNNFYAVQFHPEKSGRTGETILSNFLKFPQANDRTDSRN